MEIYIKDKDCIITPLAKCLNKHESIRLNQEIKNHLLFNIGIDLSYVENCTIDFIELIKSRKSINLFNVSSDILALLNIMNLDKIANIYVFKNDFETRKNRIINRKFKVV